MGLLYDKFCDKWPEVEGQVKWSLQNYKQKNREKNPKQEWIETVTGLIGKQNELTQACERLNRLGETIFNVKPMVFKTDWRFVTGLGRQHPVENGFSWHHALGVPYLPGSSVKGMVRAWAKRWEEKVSLDDTKRIFGSKNTEYVGNVIFFDALPDSCIRLEMDVMTPHYSPYYSDGETPGDWYDPVPIPFLTVGSGQTFQFIVAPRRPRNEQSRQDAAQAAEWLKKALKWIGAGAKTAAGYGRFTLSEPRPDEYEIWENATVNYKPNTGEVLAASGSNKAQGKNDALAGWARGIRETKSGKKKLNKGAIRRAVKVQKTGNVYRLLEIVESNGE